jgi:hypothetical protein
MDGVAFRPGSRRLADSGSLATLGGEVDSRQARLAAFG